jgi:hypothetical protein
VTVTRFDHSVITVCAVAAIMQHAILNGTLSSTGAQVATVVPTTGLT